MRNRKRIQRRGPLIVYNKDQGLRRAFRNIPGVDMVSIQKLNLLKLAPGGHVGRFIIWTRSAFEQLDKLFGTWKATSQEKSGWFFNNYFHYNMRYSHTLKLTFHCFHKLILQDTTYHSLKCPTQICRDCWRPMKFARSWGNPSKFFKLNIWPTQWGCLFLILTLKNYAFQWQLQNVTDQQVW